MLRRLTFLVLVTGLSELWARPNIILILTDDQGYGDVAVHGNPVLHTPNLDQLHRESLRLTQFHVDPTCSPTRAALMTGRYSTRTGVWHTIMGRSLLRANEQTLPEVLAANGYRTGIFGKWHLGDNYPARPQDRGFQEAVIHGGGGVGQTPDYWGNTYFDDHYLVNGHWKPFEGYCTDVFFAEAIHFMETCLREDKSRPFFVYLPTNAPHSPFRVDARYRDPYLAKDVPEPMASFYGMVENIDENVGRLRDWLKQNDQEENTLLIFLSDNGTAAGFRDNPKEGDSETGSWNGFNAGMRAIKGSPYEGGHRVPCFWHWPGGKLVEGRDIATLTAHLDVLPTLVTLCELEFSPTTPLDGKDLTPLFRHTEVDWPDRTLFVHTQREEIPPKWRNSAVLRGSWRLVHGRELYDLAEDPGQTRDIAERHPTRVRELRSLYEDWWASLQPALDQHVPIVVGAHQENPLVLQCMDWHAPTIAEIPWDQSHLRALPSVNGWWHLEVAEAGHYSILLRHHPAIANTPLRADLARVQFGEDTHSKPVPRGATFVRFELDLEAGPVRFQSFLVDTSRSESRGAFFVEFERLDGDSP